MGWRVLGEGSGGEEGQGKGQTTGKSLRSRWVLGFTGVADRGTLRKGGRSAKQGRLLRA